MKRAVVIALLALAACSPEASRVTSDPTATPTAAGDYTDVAVEWFLREVRPDDRTIEVVYTISGVASGCEKQGHATAVEFGDKVELTAYKQQTTDRMRACTEELGYMKAEVTLESTLGDRPLVGCRPPKTDISEGDVCQDPERSREHGIFEIYPLETP